MNPERETHGLLHNLGIWIKFFSWSDHWVSADWHTRNWVIIPTKVDVDQVALLQVLTQGFRCLGFGLCQLPQFCLLCVLCSCHCPGRKTGPCMELLHRSGRGLHHCNLSTSHQPCSFERQGTIPSPYTWPNLYNYSNQKNLVEEMGHDLQV